MDAKKVPAESSYGHTSDSDEFLIASTNAIHAVERKNSMTGKFFCRFLSLIVTLLWVAAWDLRKCLGSFPESIYHVASSLSLELPSLNIKHLLSKCPPHPSLRLATKKYVHVNATVLMWMYNNMSSQHLNLHTSNKFF